MCESQNEKLSIQVPTQGGWEEGERRVRMGGQTKGVLEQPCLMATSC